MARWREGQRWPAPDPARVSVWPAVNSSLPLALTCLQVLEAFGKWAAGCSPGQEINQWSAPAGSPRAPADIGNALLFFLMAPSSLLVGLGPPQAPSGALLSIRGLWLLSLPVSQPLDPSLASSKSLPSSTLLAPSSNFVWPPSLPEWGPLPLLVAQWLLQACPWPAAPSAHHGHPSGGREKILPFQKPR